jgi:HEAT repeat protein
MYPVNLNQLPDVVDITSLPIAVETQPDHVFDKLMSELFSESSWGDRQAAAQKLGYMQNPKAVPDLLDRLPADPFWMVRCAIIQALERIGDPRAIPTLQEVAKNDGFQIVRSYAVKAVQRLSLEE